MKDCPSCGGSYPDIEGPVHPYMSSTPGCWAVYGEVLAREYSDRAYFEVHRLTVDTYAVQHPGGEDRQSIQSVGVHLVRLCLFLEEDLAAEHANAAMLEAGKRKHTFERLEPPASFGTLTAADVAKAGSADEHKRLVRAWAEGTWASWSMHHDQVRAWLPSNRGGHR